jgi:hypothetical protein
MKTNVVEIAEKIAKKIKDDYNGLLVCEEQGADLYIEIDGQNESIESIDEEMVYFENDYHSVKLVDADIHIVSYIVSVI